MLKIVNGVELYVTHTHLKMHMCTGDHSGSAFLGYYLTLDDLLADRDEELAAPLAPAYIGAP